MTRDLTDAIAAFRAGRLAEAERSVRAELARNPRAAVAWNLLGAIASASGNPEAAIELIRNAVALAPREPSFRCNLSRSLLAVGNVAAAEQVLGTAREHAPDDADVLELWGIICGRQGHPAEMMTALTRCVEVAPDRASAQFNLGEAYRRQGKTDEAAAHLCKAIELDPNHVDALNNLSGLYLLRGEYLAAIRCLESLLKLRPQSAQVYCNLGAALQAVGDIEQSIDCFRKAAQLDPQAKAPSFQLANLLVATGSVAEGERIIDDLRQAAPLVPQLVATKARILERRGEFDDASVLLDELDSTQMNDPAVALATAFVREQQDKVDEAIETLEHVIAARPELLRGGWSGCFRLGKLYDRRGRYDEAFEQITMANQGRGAVLPGKATPEMSSSLLEQWKKSWSADMYARLPSSSLVDPQPIFIIGMPRSGTTLVEQIIANHPEVYGCGEIDVFGRSLQRACEECQAAERQAGVVQEARGMSLKWRTTPDRRTAGCCRTPVSARSPPTRWRCVATYGQDALQLPGCRMDPQSFPLGRNYSLPQTSARYLPVVLFSGLSAGSRISRAICSPWPGTTTATSRSWGNGDWRAWTCAT